VQAVHLECRAPSGAHFDVVALRGHVVAPEAMRQEPGLWWLEREDHAHLGMEAATALQEATGSRRLGCWPYCVPEDRWNEAAMRTYWLPQTPVCSEFPLDDRQRVITDRGLETLELPPDRIDRQRPDTDRGAPRTVRERLGDGSAAVGYVLKPIQRVPLIVLSIVSLVTCACYLAAIASWLWTLHDRPQSADVENGVVLLLAALFLSWITSLFEQRVLSDAGALSRLPKDEGRERQPVLHLSMDAYRAGMILQSLAFAGLLLM
jgi:hypothetical protein